MNILVIDGQGGQLGSQLIKMVASELKELKITAIGTNAVATSAMLKAGAHQAATGENPVLVACKKADVILGPIGIVIADSLLGEITPAMALAVSQTDVPKILIPMGKCNNIVAGATGTSINALIEDAMYHLGMCLDISDKTC